MPGTSFILALHTYDGPVVRLRMTEEDAYRFEVPGVVVEELDEKTAPFTLIKKFSNHLYSMLFILIPI